jgi:hypothetical protein
VTLGHHHYSEHRSRSAALKAAKTAVKKALREGVYYPQAGIRPPHGSSEQPITVGPSDLGEEQNPATIRAQVRRLPSGQIQLKIPIGRSENPNSVIEQLKRVFGKRVKAVEMVGRREKKDRRRNPQHTLQSAADLVTSAVPYLRVGIMLGHPDSDTGLLKLIDSKGRQAGTIAISQGKAQSVTPVYLGLQNLLGALAARTIRSSLGM